MKQNSNYKYFSQHGEDYLLWNFFDYQENGIYVDAGAFDGIHLSNSYSFELAGWAGICIEPHPSYFPICQQNRPKSICLNFACVGDEKVNDIDFYSEELGLLSGVVKDRDLDINRRYHNRGLNFDGFVKEKVSAATLNSILSQYIEADKYIDFLSVDVEGSELDVLQGLDFDKYAPRVVVVEANSALARTELTSFMSGKGYIEARKQGVNIFYTKTEADVKKLQSIAIQCYIEKNLHPKGEKYTIPKCINGFYIGAKPKVLNLAHIINPVVVGESSDLFVAQPITFETMKNAQNYAMGKVNVTLYSAQYPEDKSMVSDAFVKTPDLKTSVLDIVQQLIINN
ncbi:MAG: FkbM family methyltransferase [Microcoleaceae cyanobacterium]